MSAHPPELPYTAEEMSALAQHAERVSQVNVALDAELVKCRIVIRDALKVLHRTSISKKDVADRMRECLGLLPGERVS